jgi:hypothetical protein
LCCAPTNPPPAWLICPMARRRLAWFLSAMLLEVITLVGFVRYYALMDQDSGASHALGLLVAIIVCGLYALIVFRARTAAEALIRGRTTGTIVAALRAAIARAWLTISLTAIVALFLFFVFGLSLGLLSYYYGVTSSVAMSRKPTGASRPTPSVPRKSMSPRR